MKKNLWTRLVAAVLTTAMAFSILVVPASAAEADVNGNWAGIEESFIITKDMLKAMYLADYEEGEKPSDEAVDSYLSWTFTYLQGKGLLYEGTIPNEAYIGLMAESKIFWYDEEQVNQLMAYVKEIIGNDASTEDMAETVIENVNAEDGTITLKDGPTLKPTVTDSEGNLIATSGSDASGSNVVMIAAVAGAAAAAATGVYFYTHPEKWQEVKDYFADLSANVQAKFQEFTSGVKGALGIPTEEAETAETVENAENAAVPQDVAA